MDILEVKKRSMIDSQLKSRGISSLEVLRAMSVVPREKFVSSEFIEAAYNDGPLSIGSGQSISQPYMVAMMTEALMLRKNDKVLEIGTGSGYQAAVLQEISSHIYSIEKICSLAENAKTLLGSLGYSDIVIKVGDGTLGWPEEAPFDAIIVTSGSPSVPETLMSQLADNGRMIIPVGSMTHQRIIRITRTEGNFNKEELLSCVFVPLIGEHGWRESEI
jgi:protein-L-isoaspartate(D-aspartate) O-methyltransferase